MTGLLGEVERGGLIADEREARGVAGVGVVGGEEVEEEHVDVLDAVVAGLHRLARQHVDGDVAGHAHAPRVRLLGDDRDELGA